MPVVVLEPGTVGGPRVAITMGCGGDADPVGANFMEIKELELDRDTNAQAYLQTHGG
jgi:hypothetical protein